MKGGTSSSPTPLTAKHERMHNVEASSASTIIIEEQIVAISNNRDETGLNPSFLQNNNRHREPSTQVDLHHQVYIINHKIETRFRFS